MAQRTATLHGVQADEQPGADRTVDAWVRHRIASATRLVHQRRKTQVGVANEPSCVIRGIVITETAAS